jgi:hypothetical protein
MRSFDMYFFFNINRLAKYPGRPLHVIEADHKVMVTPENYEYHRLLWEFLASVSVKMKRPELGYVLIAWRRGAGTVEQVDEVARVVDCFFVPLCEQIEVHNTPRDPFTRLEAVEGFDSNRP